MPIYEYRCGSCGLEKEYLQRLSDPAITDCPSCGKPEMVKLVSAAGFQLKGTGWYVTDFKGGGKRGTKDTKDAEKKDGGDKSEASAASSDAAPACGAGACPACQ